MKNPIQPLVKDAHGVLRFKQNAIVRYLLDNGGIDLNRLACMNFTNDDRQQFAQLLGYSLSGYSELQSYVDDDAYKAAATMAEECLEERNYRNEICDISVDGHLASDDEQSDQHGEGEWERPSGTEEHSNPRR